jgi:hypothetical protein
MLNDQQITAIDNEISRLKQKASEHKDLPDFDVYIHARIESLKWAKENL